MGPGNEVQVEAVIYLQDVFRSVWEAIWVRVHFSVVLNNLAVTIVHSSIFHKWKQSVNSFHIEECKVEC